MRYLEDESTYILSNFTTGDTVTITVYKLSDNSKIIDAAACTEISTTGRFKYSFSQSISTKTEYLWIAENGTEEQQGKIILGGWPETVKDIGEDVIAIDVLTESGGSGDLAAIKTQVDAILDLDRASGVVSVTDAETTLFEDAAPTKNKIGVVVKLDMDALQAGDTFVVKEKYKDESGGSYHEVDAVTYTGAQSKPLRIIALTPYRYGAIITMQRTGGSNRSIKWESFIGE